MRKITSWAYALILGGFAASAMAMPQAAEFEHCGLDGVAQVSVDGMTVASLKSTADVQAEMTSLHLWLTRAAAPLPKDAGIDVALDQTELADIGASDAGQQDMQADQRRLRVGIGKPINLSVDFASLAGVGKLPASFAKGGLSRGSDGGLVWSTTLRSEGAHGLRVVLRGLDLPEEAELYVYNAQGEAHGPYYGRGINDSGEVYSNTVTGDEVTLQLHIYGKPNAKLLNSVHFEVAELAHLGSRFELARWMNPALNEQHKAFCSYNASCVMNGECFGTSQWGAIDNARKAVAHMLFPSGQYYYICTGGLINNTANNQRPLFLTANHCLSSAGSAAGLETFFDFRAASCGSTSACDLSYGSMRTAFPNVLGASLLATNKSGDFTLLELNATPAGTRHFLGFTTTAVANTSNAALYRLSHPSGAPQAYSHHRVNTAASTCRRLNRGTFIYSNDQSSQGATEGGSSGSPVMNASGQIVGQLYGACGSNPSDSCALTQNRTVDGALAAYYGSVEAFLDPSGGGGPDPDPEPGNLTTTASVLSVQVVAVAGPNKEARALVRVRDQNNNLVAGANVTGLFSGAVSGSGSGSTGSNGEVTISSSRFKTAGSVSFCVTGVTGTGITWSGTASCASGN